jgi:hypothetical protein
MNRSIFALCFFASGLAYGEAPAYVAICQADVEMLKKSCSNFRKLSDKDGSGEQYVFSNCGNDPDGETAISIEGPKSIGVGGHGTKLKACHRNYIGLKTKKNSLGHSTDSTEKSEKVRIYTVITEAGTLMRTESLNDEEAKVTIIGTDGSQLSYDYRWLPNRTDLNDQPGKHNVEFNGKKIPGNLWNDQSINRYIAGDITQPRLDKSYSQQGNAFTGKGFEDPKFIQSASAAN